jgi:pimeloyl-ACP methyl ester carboxylesterase
MALPRFVSPLFSAGLSLLIVAAVLSTALAQPPKPPAGKSPTPKAGTPKQPPKTGRPPGRPPTAVRPPAGKPGAKKEEEEKKPPPPESTFLKTKDGWSIYCTYYGPMEDVRSGKEVVPIILLHGWEGRGVEYDGFAKLLQSIGCAVMVPDLRGHGRSTTCKRPDRRTGELLDEVVKVDDLTTQDLAGMPLDVEAVKKELMVRHNEAELNIEMLCVAGADVGAIVAMNWAVMDWSWPVTPAYKQGQDVKGLILLSPKQTFKGMNATQALAHPAVDRQLSVMIAVGEEDRRAFSDAKRIYSRIERGRETYTDPEDRRRKLDYFFFTAPTTLQGTRLLSPQLEIYKAVGMFLQWRFFDKAEEYPWAERKNPLGN